MVSGASSTIGYSRSHPYPGISVRLNKLGQLNQENVLIGEKVDPELTMRENVSHFSIREKISKKEREIDDGVRRKKIHDTKPYGVKEKHFNSRAKAEQFVLKTQEGLAPLLDPAFVQGQAQNGMPSDVIDIPVYNPSDNPKVVTVLKTNRPQEAVELFWETQVEQPTQGGDPKKPSLLRRISNLFKPKQFLQQPVNREASPRRDDDVFDRDEFIARLAREQWYTYGF